MNIEDYDLELEKVIKAIKDQNPKKGFRVCIQLPEGIKPYANKICKEIENEGVEVIIWAGSHWGACDTAIDAERLGVDMLVTFGHSAWEY